MKIFRPGIYLVIILGLVFWTGSRDLSRAASGEVIITHASMSTSSIPLWVAARQNFFSKYGVKARTVWVRGNPAQIATLVSGDTQIAYGGAPTAMAAAVGGRDMKIIASLSSRENLDLVARPGITSAKICAANASASRAWAAAYGRPRRFGWSISVWTRGATTFK